MATQPPSKNAHPRAGGIGVSDDARFEIPPQFEPLMAMPGVIDLLAYGYRQGLEDGLLEGIRAALPGPVTFARLVAWRRAYRTVRHIHEPVCLTLTYAEAETLWHERHYGLESPSALNGQTRAGWLLHVLPKPKGLKADA